MLAGHSKRLYAAIALPLIVAALLYAAPVRTPAAQGDIQQLVKTFDYDSKMPLNAEIKIDKERSDLTKYHLTFDSVDGERIPALLYIPAKKQGPLPCVIFQHGYGMDKSFADFATGFFIKKGYAIIAIDFEYHGERKEAGKDIFSTDAQSDFKALRQSIIDLRRVVDYLESDSRIDTAKIGYIGFSMGSLLGVSFVGVDSRVKTAVFVVGGGDWKTIIDKSTLEIFENIRNYTKEHGQTTADFAAVLDPVDPIHYVGLIAPRPILFINGAQDVIVPNEATNELFAAAKEPKEIKWYPESGHVVDPGKVAKDSLKWFKEYLEK